MRVRTSTKRKYEKEQSELKNTRTKKKNILEGINSGLDDTAENQ